jgi:RHS repeat-associated protein
VSGIAGLAAIETSTTEPELQLTDLDGNVIGKVSTSETASKLLSTERSTEYGVPTTTKPAKYSWLGGDLLPTELPSGTVAMGARSYVPQIGRFLQNDPIPGGSANAYAYTNGNLINETDLTGDYVENNYSARIFAEEDNEAIEQEAAREAAAREIAEREAQIAAAEAALQAKEAAEQASISPQNQAATGALGGSPGWAREYAAETGQEGAGCEEAGGSSFITYPDDKSPNVQSTCNQTGQDCPGRRGGGHEGNGPETIETVCVFGFWVPPVGAVCGAYEVGKYIGEHVR